MTFKELNDGARFIKRPLPDDGGPELGKTICKMYYKLNQNHGHNPRHQNNCMSDFDKDLYTMPANQEVVLII